MGNPTAGDLHINTPLTNLSIAYRQSDTGFVSEDVFPVVPVQKQSDAYYIFDRADWNRNTMQKRARAAESAGGGYRVSNDTYFAHVWALHKDIADIDRSNADSMFKPDSDATMWLTDQLRMNREKEFASTYLTTGVWGLDLAGTASSPTLGTSFLQWSDPNSTPVQDIRYAMRRLQVASTLKANTLTVTIETWHSLMDHPDILDRIKGAASPSSPAVVQRQAIAGILELDRILVMESVENTAGENLTESNAYIGSKKALLTHSAKSPGLNTPSAGYTFAWNGYLGGSLNQVIRRFRMEHTLSDRVEIETAYVKKVTGSSLGVYFSSAVA